MAGANTTPLRIGAIGYSVREQLLLRSLVRIAGSSLPQPWEFVDAPPYYALFTPPDIDNPRSSPGAVRIFVDAPLKSEGIAALLDNLKVEFPRLSRGMADGTPGRTQAAPAQTAAALTDDRTDVARRLMDRQQAPFAWTDGSEYLVIVDPVARTWYAPSVADVSSGPSAARELAARLARGGMGRVDLSSDEQSTPHGPVHRLEPLLWHVGLLISPDSVLPHVRRMPRLRLARWPDFGTVGSDALHLKLSALLISRAYSIDELLQASGGAGERTVAFLNACTLCDLFLGESVESRPRVSSAPRHFSRVMRVVRGALGMAGA